MAFTASRSGVSRVFALIFSILFIAIGILTPIIFNPKSYDGTTTGTIVALDQHLGVDNEQDVTVYIDYTVDGVRYSHMSYNSYNSSMQVGDTVKVCYNTSDPTQSSAPFGKTVLFMSIMFIFLGILTLFRSLRGFIRRF